MGLHTSQRVVGQEMAVEVVSTDAPMAAYADVAISSISQATTTLTVTTATPHGLMPGARIGIRDCTDSRMNYPAAVVASINSLTQFTVTGGPNGSTLPSVTAGPFTSGFVYARKSMGLATNGTSMIFENSTATNASFYARADSGDVLPSGTLVGNHSVTVGSSSSTVAATTQYTYAFQPTNEYRLTLGQDQFMWTEAPTDTASASTNRHRRTQVIPNPKANYKLRFRLTNNKSVPIPVGQIVSAVKTGTSVATVTFDRPHGLSVADVISIRGCRDQTNFVNSAALTVASVIDATTITVAFGLSVTATTYGGIANRQQGGIDMPGAISGAVQSVQVSATNIVNVIGNASWAGFVIGDYINLVGVRDNTTGAAVANIDGAYRVRNFSTTNLELEPIDGRTVAVAALVNCGGAVIRRTDLRISYVRIMDYVRERVEIQSRATSDAANSIPVSVQNTASFVAQPGTFGIGYVGQQLPLTVADIASAALTTTTTTSAVTPAFGNAYEVNIPVTAVSGTNPTMDVVVQESDDAGTNWYDVYHFPRITATGMYRSPVLNLKGNRVRYVQTVGGTSPSFTRSLNRLQISDKSSKWFRRFFERAFNSTQTSGTYGTAFQAHDCTTIQLMVSCATQGSTPPQFQIAVSDDGVNYTAMGAAATAVTGNITSVTLNTSAEFIKVYCSVTGVGATLNWVDLKAW